MLASLAGRGARQLSTSAGGVTVAVTGAGTAIGAATLKSIAAGEVFGSSTPVRIIAVGGDPAVASKLSESPLVKSATAAKEISVPVDYAILLDSSAQKIADASKAIAKSAPSAVVSVLGNTNALVAAAGAPKATVTAVTRHVQMDAEDQLAAKLGAKPKNVIAWGTGVADLSHATVDGDWALDKIESALPATSADVSAKAVISHVKDLACGSDGQWASMGVPAVGDFGTGTGIFYSVPTVTFPGGSYKRVGGISLTADVAEAMEKSRLDLLAEKEKVKNFL